MFCSAYFLPKLSGTLPETLSCLPTQVGRLVLLNFLEFKNWLPAEAVPSPSLEFLRPDWAKPWVTWSELTEEPALSSRLDCRSSKGLSTSMVLGILT